MATKSLEILIDEFNRLPGIGRKSATRLAFYVLEMSEAEIERFSKALKDAKENVKKCRICGNFSEEDVCEICSDLFREKDIICVVEDGRDIIPLEKTKRFKGSYHVLGGKIDPLNGITPDKLNLKSLLERVANGDIKEIIIALNPDLEGETTSIYLTKLLKPFEIKITKIASGIPMGGNLEFADVATITKALEGRQEL